MFLDDILTNARIFLEDIEMTFLISRIEPERQRDMTEERTG